MALDLRRLIAEAENLATPFVARPVNMQFCSVHPNTAYGVNWAGLLVCPDLSHRDTDTDTAEE